VLALFVAYTTLYTFVLQVTGLRVDDPNILFKVVDSQTGCPVVDIFWGLQ